MEANICKRNNQFHLNLFENVLKDIVSRCVRRSSVASKLTIQEFYEQVPRTFEMILIQWNLANLNSAILLSAVTGLD